VSMVRKILLYFEFTLLVAIQIAGLASSVIVRGPFAVTILAPFAGPLNSVSIGLHPIALKEPLHRNWASQTQAIFNGLIPNLRGKAIKSVFRHRIQW
jgi:hypothetical protein